MKKLRIVLAEDHAIVRAGLKSLVNAEADMEVIGETDDGVQAAAMIENLRPDIAVIDLAMPGMTGVEVARRIAAAAISTRLIALTAHEEGIYLQQTLEAGAVGFVLKRAAAEELNRAIRAVAQGRTYIDPRVAESVVDRAVAAIQNAAGAESALSTREDEVIQLIAQGFTIKEVAAKLGLSAKTIESYKVRSMEKLGVRGRVELVQEAVARGWLHGPGRQGMAMDPS